MPTKVEGLVVGFSGASFPSGYSVVLSYALSPQGTASHKTPNAQVDSGAKFELALSDVPTEMFRITATLFDQSGQALAVSPLTLVQVRAASVGNQNPVRPARSLLKGLI